ncbi:3-phosphoshikimate 1-carboxyvinyltransferase [Chloroflexota bacterium]
MRVSLHKSEVKGKVSVPSSKSYTIRGLMCAALARGESEILNPLLADDTEAAIDVLSKIGISIRQRKNSWRVSGGNFHKPDGDLFCRDSAATLRFMTAVCSLVPGKCRLTAGASLSRRPAKPLIDALTKLGLTCSSHGDGPSVIVEGGRLKGGQTELPGDISSQFVSALLFIAPFAEEGVRIRLTTPLTSKPYVTMTLECLDRFGVKVTQKPDSFEIANQTYKPAKYSVEGDWSSASYLLALGATSGEVEVGNLNPSSLQGDKIMLDFLRDMGAVVEVKDNAIKIKKARLKAIRADLSDCIDLLPTMAALAAAAEGVSEFTGIAGARLKESNRVTAVKDGLERMGIKVTEERDKLIVAGGKIKNAEIDSWNDHRIAMAFSIIGTAVGGIRITGAECVGKTFPGFWDILKSIGGKLETDEQ